MNKLASNWYLGSKSPNCPEQRVIESYWSITKGTLLKSKKIASDKEDFKKKWIVASKIVTLSKIQEVMSSSRKNIRFLSKHLNM